MRAIDRDILREGDKQCDVMSAGWIRRVLCYGCCEVL